MKREPRKKEITLEMCEFQALLKMVDAAVEILEKDALNQKEEEVKSG